MIVSNVLRDIKYKYFIPSQIKGGVPASVSTLVASLKDSGLHVDEINNNLEIYEVPDANLFVNITLHDPYIGQNCGFILPAYSDKEKAFQVTLDDDLHDRIRGQMQEWITSAKKVYPLSRR